MKKAFILFTVLLTFLTGLPGCNSSSELSPQTNAPTETPINYKVTGYYFVKNTFKFESNPAYLLIRSYPSFDSIFGVGAVMNMDRSKLITEDEMKNGFILSIIYHGNNITEFGMEKILLNDNQLQVYFSSKVTTPNSTWTGNFHITSLVQNCQFKTVALYENGKLLKDVAVKEIQ